MKILILTQNNFIISKFIEYKLNDVKVVVKSLEHMKKVVFRDYEHIYTTNGREQLEVFRHLFSLGEDYRDIKVTNLDISWIGDIGNISIAKDKIAKAIRIIKETV